MNKTICEQIILSQYNYNNDNVCALVVNKCIQQQLHDQLIFTVALYCKHICLYFYMLVRGILKFDWLLLGRVLNHLNYKVLLLRPHALRQSKICGVIISCDYQCIIDTIIGNQLMLLITVSYISHCFVVTSKPLVVPSLCLGATAQGLCIM